MQPTHADPTTQPVQASKLMWPRAVVQPAEPLQPVQLVQPVQPVQPVESVQPVQPVQPGWSYRMDPAAERPPAVPPTYRASQLLYLLLGSVEALMITRMVLKLLAANADVGFVRFIYGVSAPLVAPFRGIFPTPASHSNALELSSLVAIAVYALVAWGIVRLVFILGRQQLPRPAR
jgi:uncharacterized protein YggT (Ycf19 family)